MKPARKSADCAFIVVAGCCKNDKSWKSIDMVAVEHEGSAGVSVGKEKSKVGALADDSAGRSTKDEANTDAHGSEYESTLDWLSPAGTNIDSKFEADVDTDVIRLPSKEPS